MARRRRPYQGLQGRHGRLRPLRPRPRQGRTAGAIAGHGASPRPSAGADQEKEEEKADLGDTMASDTKKPKADAAPKKDAAAKVESPAAKDAPKDAPKDT